MWPYLHIKEISSKSKKTQKSVLNPQTKMKTRSMFDDINNDIINILAQDRRRTKAIFFYTVYVKKCHTELVKKKTRDDNLASFT